MDPVSEGRSPWPGRMSGKDVVADSVRAVDDERMTPTSAPRSVDLPISAWASWPSWPVIGEL